MSIKKRVDVSCDWPTQGEYSWERTCQAGDWMYGSSGAQVRREAAKAGWMRIADYDFCGRGDPADESDPGGESAGGRPLPNHAARLAGHAFTAVAELVTGYRRYRAGCACGWVCPDGALHLSTYGKDSAAVYHPGGAAGLWLELHVREDLAGLPPLWTAQRIEAVNQRTAQPTAGHAAV